MSDALDAAKAFASRIDPQTASLMPEPTPFSNAQDTNVALNDAVSFAQGLQSQERRKRAAEGMRDAWQTFGAPVVSAVTAPGDILAGKLTPQDPRFADSAITAAGLATTGGMPFAEEGALGSAGGKIVAYHGSPHDFDRFDMSKIGSGEGAQAYGHGLYFAENEGIAKSYRDGLAPGSQYTLNGVPISQLSEATQRVFNWMRNTKTTPEEIAKISDQRASKAMEDAKSLGLDHIAEAYAKDHTDTAAAARSLIGKPFEVGAAPNGHMYQVGINADPEHFLDWDKPLSEQPKVLEAARQMGPGVADRVMREKDLPGKQLADIVANEHLPLGQATDANISAAMRKAGIPGIKYFDAGSRTAGDGSRNYVVFDDKTIDILKKYGLAGVGLGSAGLAAAGGAPDANAAPLDKAKAFANWVASK